MTKWWNEALPTRQMRRSRYIRDAVKKVVEGGGSYASASGATLVMAIEAFEEAGVRYTIRAFPGRGYDICRDKDGAPD